MTVTSAGHPLCPDLRRYLYAAPVEIGDNCWIGAGAVICPGVTIGRNSAVGPGSVVTGDVPENCAAAGNPCQVIRAIGPDDRQFYSQAGAIDGGIQNS